MVEHRACSCVNLSSDLSPNEFPVTRVSFPIWFGLVRDLPQCELTAIIVEKSIPPLYEIA